MDFGWALDVVSLTRKETRAYSGHDPQGYRNPVGKTEVLHRKHIGDGILVSTKGRAWMRWSRKRGGSDRCSRWRS